MFYKEDYSFELGTYAASTHIHTHIKLKAMEQFDRFNDQCKAKSVDIANSMKFSMTDLSYMWAMNLEVGVQTMAVYRNGFESPIIVIDEKMPWAGEAHHKHMAEFVNHHTEKSPSNQRKMGAEFIIRQLNLISLAHIEEDIRVISNWDCNMAAIRALNTIDAGKVA